MNLDQLIDNALAEDLRGGSDVTSVATIAENANSSAEFVARNEGVVAGIAVAVAVFSSTNFSYW
jgi:nicotinate-nucleotide pyrophosphorylase (carboxylating)